MREKSDCQDLQKHLKEGRRDCYNEGTEGEGMMNESEMTERK